MIWYFKTEQNIDDDCCCRSRNIALTVVQTTLEWLLDTKMTSCSRYVIVYEALWDLNFTFYDQINLRS